MYCLTEKVKELITNAEMIAVNQDLHVITPLDLFLGAAYVKKGTLLEMYILIENQLGKLIDYRKKQHLKANDYLTHKDFSIPMTGETEKIWKRSLEIMSKYRQIYLFE
ncbi:hypothetical protein JOC86_000735 [Bacillus pakistanensis]|uniref:Uncharacterized protein n=1 Tax=Rossellomorea pakistanensis TaxID=992288 RepID=A0ABS2N8N4_9BACI|nr:hypothetical protein [Bacillus pakistanensis]MBM7584198.1 hypothetical protein [Bacillus pakistanensis]